jgi:membrane protein
MDGDEHREADRAAERSRFDDLGEDRMSRERGEGGQDGQDDPDDMVTVGDLGKRSWIYVVRKTVREFLDDQCTDLAAALTYYSVLSLFPAALALLSLLGVVKQGPKAVNAILDILRPLVSSTTLDKVAPTLRTLADSQGASLTLVVGILGAIWSASAYIQAFSRAMNRIYEVPEGRPFWKLRPLMLLLTVVTIVLCAIVLLVLVVSGPVTGAVGDKLGVGSSLQTAWSIAKWPVLAVVVILVVALLYYVTPNVKPPRFRLLSIGAFVAILVWVIASVGFGFYVANFSSYNKTYGSVAAVIVGLLWLWLTNLALLFGAELDSELERARELNAGVAAEETLQLPLRSTRAIDKADKRREKDIANGREIRESQMGSGDPGDRPFGRRR